MSCSCPYYAGQAGSGTAAYIRDQERTSQGEQFLRLRETPGLATFTSPQYQTPLVSCRQSRLLTNPGRILDIFQ